ncbi:MAG: hypothetical protein FWD19_01320 [Defluviitaleaceae bacterium]|nr:hypothetical protein [Defluviitaleaceae bacterium]
MENIFAFFVSIIFSLCVPAANNSFEKIFNNTIDDFFHTRIEAAQSQVERREYQDAYLDVWKSLFEDIFRMTDLNDDYKKSAEQRIFAFQAAQISELQTQFGDDFIFGSGTRSMLNQLSGEVYRDFAIRIIEYFWQHGRYIYLNADYLYERFN